jgi:NADPH2:quinone reductase
MGVERSSSADSILDTSVSGVPSGEQLTARALVCKEFGPIENLVIEERPVPEPEAGEVLVEVRAAGLNFPDALIVLGEYQVKPSLPFVPGGEAAGVVASVGDDVSTVQPGDRVIVPMGPAFATFTVAQAEHLLKMPDNMTFHQGAGFCITYGTSYYALKQCAAIRPGETLLVLGAAGGVGATAVEIGKAMGATVIAAASTEEKLDFACGIGADHRINYSTEDLKRRTKELSKGLGVNVIFDPVGGAYTEQAFRAIAWNGRHLVIGFACGTIPKLPLNLPLLKGGSVAGVWWGTWASKHPEDSRRNFDELLAMVERGGLSPPVTQVFPLEEYVEAFRCLTERRAKGKVIFEMAR